MIDTFWSDYISWYAANGWRWADPDPAVIAVENLVKAFEKFADALRDMSLKIKVAPK